MQKELLRFGAKATNSYKRSFSQQFESSIMRLALVYAGIVAAILLVAGGMTYSLFARRAQRRFAHEQLVFSSRPPKSFFSKEEKKFLPPTDREVRGDLFEAVLVVDSIVLAIASLFGYWFARRTLRPIKHAYELQQQFLADVSHELRTPLTILQLNLENELHTAKEAARQTIQDNLQEVTRMTKMVNDILLISRLEQTVHDSKAITALAPLVKECAQRLAPLARAHHVVVHEPLFLAEGDTTCPAEVVVHALTNVLQNAIMYNKPSGTVTLTVSDTPTHYCIQVEDTGIGIAPGACAQIFDRFYRVDKSRTRATGGSGLGLAIAQSALTYCGGTISLKSVVDKGTIVTMQFPRAHKSAS